MPAFCAMWRFILTLKLALLSHFAWKQVDPQFQRTVVVASKFDNRLKEFSERWEVDRSANQGVNGSPRRSRRS